MTDFAAHMIDACTYAQAGFYFEESGCFGMAAAMYDAFTEDGHLPKLMVMDGFTHVMVELSGNLYDHQGKVLTSPVVREIQYANLKAHAIESGRAVDDYEADKIWANEIITSARELAVCYERLTASAMENFGFRIEEAERFVNILRDSDAVAAIATSLVDADQILKVQGKLMPAHEVLTVVSPDDAELLDRIYKDPYALTCLQDMVERTKQTTFWDAVREPDVSHLPGI
jgi:hypothetical protein